MMKNINSDYPTYLELGLDHGEIKTVNGKEFSSTGIINVLNYISSDCRVNANEVIDVAKHNSPKEGCIKLKLFNGNVKCL
ncbi:MAG: hypothetical protein GX078_02850 [Clostridiales bacterium]|nr:hypothetical protein [Clostridiales bacterium]